MRYTALVPFKGVLSPLIIKSLHPLRYIMKLHLPKSLLLSLLSALTLAAPLAVTLGSTAWAGWGRIDENGSTVDNNTYYLDSVTTSSVSSVGLSDTNLFIRTNNVADYKTATVTTLELGEGQTMNIDGSWDDPSMEFECLTLENIQVAAGVSELHVSADNAVMLNSVSGAGTLNLSVDGEVSFGPNFNGSLGTVTNNNSNNKSGIINIASDFDGTTNGAISNSGIVVLQQGSTDVVLNKLVGRDAGKYNPSVISNTSTGNLVIENTGNKTLNGGITIANGGTVTLRGGTFGTSSAAITLGITQENTTLAFENIDAYIGGTERTVTGLWVIGDLAHVRFIGSDVFHWNNNLNLKVLTGGVLDLQGRQSVKNGSSIILAGGTLKGEGANADDNIRYGLDFYNGGTITVTHNSCIETNIGGHKDKNYEYPTVNFDVAEDVNLTMTGNLVGPNGNTFVKENAGTMVYSGAAFNQALTISGGVFEYNFTGERTHTGNISGTGTLRKSGNGTLNLSSANTSDVQLAVTGGKLVYTVADGEKTHTLSGTGGTFEKAGAGTLNLGAMKDYAYTGSLTVTEGNVKFAGTDGNTDDDEDAENVPSFVTLITHLTTVNDAKVEITGNVLFNYKLVEAADSVINIDDNITITGNLRINSYESVNAPDNDGMRRWNVLTGANLNVGGLLWLTNDQKMVVSGGHVTADGGIKLGHDQNDDNGAHHSKIVIESGTVTTTGVTFNAGENDVVMSGGKLTFSPTKDGAQVLSDGSGVNRFTVTGGTLKATDKSWALKGTSTHVVSLGNATFDIAADKTITLSGTMALTGSLDVVGDGTLQVGDTTWNVQSSDLANFMVTGGVVNDSTKENGLGTYSDYIFIRGNVEQQPETATSILVDNAATTIHKQDGYWTFTGTAAGAYVIGGNFSTEEAATDTDAVGADVFVVNKEGVFTIAGDIADGKTVTQLLTTTMGSGEIQLTTNTTLSDGNNMVFGGTLAIADGTTLNVGATEANVIDLSTLQEIRLDGGTIRYQAHAGDVKHLNVTSNSLLHIYDMNSETMNVGKVSVAANAALTVNSLENDPNNVAWNHQLNIGVLTGDGAAVFNGPGDPTGGDKKEGNISSLTINSLKGFTGDLTVSSREETGNKKRYNVIIKTGADGADFNKLDVSGFITQACTFVVEGNTSVNVLNVANGIVNLSEGVVLALGDGTTSSNHSIGTVSTTVNGTIHLNNGATLNAFTKGEGSGTITLTGSGVFDLGNAQKTYDINSDGNQDVNQKGDFALASGWTGTVRIEGADHQTDKLGLNLNNLSNANSAVELINVNGWFGNANGVTMEGELILTEDENAKPAWCVNNGASDPTSANKTMATFNGAVSGNGTMKITWDTTNYTGFNFNGNISEWEGAFVNSESAKFNLNLGDAANTVNATIKNTGNGELHLKVGTDSAATFNEDVSVTKLTLNQQATFNKTLSVGEASISAKDSASGGAVMSGVVVDSTGIHGNSTAAVASEGSAAGGSVSNALIELKNATSYSIENTTFDDVKLTAAQNAIIQLQNVQGNAVLSGGNYVMQAVYGSAVEPRSTSGTPTLQYQVAGSWTVDNAQTTTITLTATPGADCGHQLGVYDLVFALNLDFTDEAAQPTTLDGWKALVTFGGEMATLLEEQDAGYALAGTEEALTMQNPYVMYDYNAADNLLIVTVSGLTVPEPTTATLSLLALAALAVRRRRR